MKVPAIDPAGAAAPETCAKASLMNIVFSYFIKNFRGYYTPNNGFLNHKNVEIHIFRFPSL